jgi:hypothetical protein
MDELFLEWIRENRGLIETLRADGYLKEGLIERVDDALRILNH